LASTFERRKSAKETSAQRESTRVKLFGLRTALSTQGSNGVYGERAGMRARESQGCATLAHVDEGFERRKSRLVYVLLCSTTATLLLALTPLSLPLLFF
jgi:hypothetical protein